MATNEVFYGQVKKGKIGEYALYNYFTNKGLKVDDLSNENYFRKKDIDLKVTFKDGAQQYIEVKTDFKTRYTGNLYIEVWSNMQLNNRGWLYTTQADFLFYCIYGTGLCYIFKLDDLKEYIKQKQPQLKQSYNYEDDKMIAGYLLKLDDLQKELNYQLIELQELND